MKGEFLSKIIESTSRDLEARKKQRPQEELQRSAPVKKSGRLTQALRSPVISVIAEIKRASPSQGDIRPDLDVADIAGAYERGGAAAISVLTEERYFKGSLDDLKQAREACSLPLIRKDFIIDPYQVWEAAEAGADAVLLIVAALSDSRLAELYGIAGQQGLDCVVEVHDREELARAMEVHPAIVGINNRDLKTFAVDLETTLNLIKSVPDEVIVVGESGIRDAHDVSRLAQAGVDAILVGESLMRSDSPGDRIKELLSF